MKRQAKDTTALVYAYGCGQPTVGLEAALAELERIRALWDTLVSIEGMHERRAQEAAQADKPELGEIAAAIGRINEALGALFDERARTRNDADMIDINRHIDALVEERRGHFRLRGEVLREWRREHADTVRALEQRRRDEVVAARKASEAWWPNYNRVLQMYDVARGQCMKTGRRLRPSDAERDDGWLAVQIQRTRSGLGAAPEELQLGQVAALQIARMDARAWSREVPLGERRRRHGGLQQSVVEMRIDRAGNMIRLPLIMHRPLPEGARAKAAQLVWRRAGDRLRWRLCLTLSTPARHVVSTARSACGIVLGASVQPNGSLQVASVYGSDGQRESMALDASWMAGMDHVLRLCAQIDEGVIEMAQWVRAHRSRVAEEIYQACARWRPGRHASAVASALVEEIVGVGRGRMPEALLAWRKSHRRARHERDYLRAKLLRQRGEDYRLIARDLATRYCRIALSEPTATEGQSGARVRAALSILVSEIMHQAQKAGAQIIRCDAASTLDDLLATATASAAVMQAAAREESSPYEAPEEAETGALASSPASSCVEA